jgi:lipopolysaccharide biosynthesis glycosyltransferase
MSKEEMVMIMLDNAIDICFVSNASYIKFISVTAASILDNTKSSVNFHILLLGDNFIDRLRFGDFIAKFPNAACEFIFIDKHISVFEELDKAWFKDHTPYAKLLIPSLTKCDKAIYFDGDMIMLRDVKELWDVDLKCFALAASKEDYRLVDISTITNFNSGLLIFDCITWRRDNLLRQVVDHAINNKDDTRFFNGADQRILNMFFETNYLILDYDYNREPAHWKDEDKPAFPSACNIHYCNITGVKPHSNPYIFKSELWWEYCRKTPFYEIFIADMILERIEVGYYPPPPPVWLRRAVRKRNPIRYFLLYILSHFIFGSVKRKFKIKFNDFILNAKR